MARNLLKIASFLEVEQDGIRFVLPNIVVVFDNITVSGSFSYFLPLCKKEANNAVSSGRFEYDGATPEEMRVIKDYFTSGDYDENLGTALLNAGFSWGRNNGVMIGESGMQETGAAVWDMPVTFRTQMRQAYEAHLAK